MRTARIPAMANAHSHAFQIDLRGIGERVGGPGAGDDFWSWRTEMYRLAARHDPESMGAVGARAYRAMAAAGYRAVGEFHYVVHQPDGTPYPDPNAMAIALARAAVGAGLEIVLLPAAYARGGFQVELAEGQRRFVDPDVDVFLKRLDDLRAWAQDQPGVAVGVAVHSVRAVPAEWIEAVARYAQEHDLVRHVHASEQVRELDECWSEHGCSPVELLADCGYLSPRTSVVHGIHVSDRDISLLAESNSIVVTCPTTEGNLGDGIFPGPRYREAGVRIAIGTDSQVRIDPFEELREMETLARRQGQTRDALLA
ncbi:MAG TPA: formimidoylglutamate deiminase, partial [Solirubrobacteraceae bacterium]